MFNQKVTILPVFLAVVLLYLILGECLAFKFLFAAVAAFLVYINYMPAINPACRNDDCIISPVYATVSDITYNNKKVTITLEKDIFQSALVTMPLNSYVEVSNISGAVLGDGDLAQTLNQKIIYTNKDGSFSMQIVPKYCGAQNYVKEDRHYIGDIIARSLVATVTITLEDADVKVAIGDKVKAKTTVLAYRYE
ncbi:MAG: hypothetical protein ACQESH_05195 [Campylobacterota bacterium]